MSKKNILFISKVPLKNPMRGTPLRIYKFIDQISRYYNIIVSADNIDSKLNVEFFKFPNIDFFSKFLFFRKIIMDRKIRIVMTATGSNIKLLIALKIFCKVKIVIDLHGLDFEEPYYYGYINKFTRIKREILFKFYLHFYDLIFVVSNKLKEYFININKNIKIIYGGVDINNFISVNYKPRNYLSIGYMGNMRSYQGLDLLLKAVKNIKNKNLFPLKLNLVVSGKESKIKKIIHKYNLGNEVNLNCNIRHNNVNYIINNSDVLVIPRPGNIKITEYAYPSKLPEYLATGIVTIITDVGPVKELLNNSNSCIIINTNNIIEDLEKSLEKVYNMDYKSRKIIGKSAIKFVNNSLTWNILGKKINKHLRELK